MGFCVQAILETPVSQVPRVPPASPASLVSPATLVRMRHLICAAWAILNCMTCAWQNTPPTVAGFTGATSFTGDTGITGFTGNTAFTGATGRQTVPSTHTHQYESAVLKCYNTSAQEMEIIFSLSN